MPTTHLRPPTRHPAGCDCHRPPAAPDPALRLLAEQMPCVVWTTDATPAFTASYGAGLEAIGFTPGEMIGVPLADLFPPGHSAIDAHRRALAGEAVRYDAEFRGRWFDCRIEPLRGPGGVVAGCVGVALDVTERKAAERKNARDALILANVRDSVVVTDPAGIVTYWNEGAEQIFGWTAAEVVGRSYFDRFPEAVRPWLVEEFGKRLAGDVWDGEFEDYHKDGSRVWIDARVRRLTDDAGAVVGLIGIAHDISARKRAEEELRRTADLLRAVADTTTDAVFVKDRAGKYLFFNDAAARFVGRPAAEVIGNDDTALFDPESARRVMDRDRRVMDAGATETEEEELTAAGATRVYQATKGPYRDPAGNVAGLIGVSRDVTDRKRAEAALRESEERFRLLFEVNPQPMWVYDTDSLRFLAVNDAAGWHYGYARDEFLGMTIKDIRPDGAARWLEDALGWRPGSGLSASPAVHRTKAGARIDVEVHTKDFPYGGRPARLVLALDVTDRSRAEAALRASEERFRAFMDTAPFLAWITAPDGRVVYVNETYRRALALPGPAEGVHLTDLFPPDVAAKYLDNNRIVIDTGRVLTGVEPGVLADGSEAEFLVSKFPVPGPGGGRLAGGIAADITDRRRAERELLLRDRAIQAVTQGILITDPTLPDNPVVYVSPGFERLTGYTADEVRGRNCRFLQGPGTDPGAAARLREAIAAGEPCTVELVNYRKDGTPFWNELSVSPVRDADGAVVKFVGVQADVTARRQLEEQYRQAQKMEAVGRLAGGVAHDFNNLLTVINGFADLLAGMLADDPDAHPLVEEIGKAGKRAAGLTRQLLAFSRKQVLQPKLLDLNVLVADLGKMLHRLLGEDVELVLALDPAARKVRVDPGQLEQVVMNLAVNARDAMPTGGRLTIETRNEILDPAYAEARSEVRPGSYVRLAVTDTGCGMDRKTLARIFEPFFTTKGEGRGTGLGLPTVYGIVKQSGGHVEVHSEPGAGTTFEVFLPAADADGGPRSQVGLPAAAPGGRETVLLVEDEGAVRELTRRLLRTKGYDVLEAPSGADALAIAAAHRGPIDLLLTDLVMPGMDGRQLAARLAGVRPEVKVLFMSGYTDDAVVRHGISEAQVAFLQKPYTPDGLARKVREVLDARPA